MSEEMAGEAKSRARLTLRYATSGDVENIIAMMKRAYPTMPVYAPTNIIGQITAFPSGQMVAVDGEKVVGYSASFRVAEALALTPHTWSSITGGGFASRHDPQGDWLYGMEVCVDPAARGRRVGQRLYAARRQLTESLCLKGIVFGGRMPGLRRRARQYPSPEAYLEAVASGTIVDQVHTFQRNNGFQPIAILRDYLPSDTDSMGDAAHMIWRNPYFEEEAFRAQQADSIKPKDWVRIGVVQFQQRAVDSFETFVRNMEYFVDAVSGHRADFVLFPELLTMQLLAYEQRAESPRASIERLAEKTDDFVAACGRLAVSYNINIIAGSHPVRAENGTIRNRAFVFLRDGSVHFQDKIHPTPNETRWWSIEGGDEVSIIPTDCGPIGVLICYDSEFPELSRRLADQGARILFVPFCTDNRQGYLRVRYCSQARAIENQFYVAIAGNVGNLPGVDNMDIQYAQSAIFTPSDFPFARDGVAAETSENVETVAIADLDLSDLAWARQEGTVRNLQDRRFDLYQVTWRDKGRKD